MGHTEKRETTIMFSILVFCAKTQKRKHNNFFPVSQFIDWFIFPVLLYNHWPIFPVSNCFFAHTENLGTKKKRKEKKRKRKKSNNS